MKMILKGKKMKTLNQVINQLKEITDNPTENDLENEGYYLAKDCLHYLLELQHIGFFNKVDDNE